MRFPQLIHVRIEDSRDGEEFLVVDSVDDIDGDGTPVATYRLQSVGKVRVTREYVPRKRSS